MVHILRTAQSYCAQVCTEGNLGNSCSGLSSGGAAEASPHPPVPIELCWSVPCSSAMLPNLCYPEVSKAEIPENLPQCFVITNLGKVFPYDL